jgi:predicted nucleic acid-binding protein
MKVLLDTDVVIEILRTKNPGILDSWNELASNPADVLISPITSAEVWAGAWPRERTTTEEFFDSMTCLPIDYEIAQIAGDFLRQYSKSHGLKIGDALIAATAIRHNAALWTRNRKHYPMPQPTFFS